MPTITRLIKKIAANPSTEELIFFIADNDGMVKECLGLQKRLETDNSRDLDDLDGLCRNHHISLEMLTQEVHRILAIFAPDSVNDEYAVLGLKANADQKQVKNAFRKLSIKYHPDSSGSGDSDKFIEICQAYKVIISRSESSKPTTHSGRTTSWRYTKKRGLSPQQKRRNIYLFSTLAVILLIISVIAPYLYRKKVMRHNLNSTDPVLAGRPEISKVPLPEENPVPSKPAADSEVRAEHSRLQDEVFAINIAEPDTANLSPALINLETISHTPEHPTVISKPEPRKQPPVSSKPEPKTVNLHTASKKQKLSAAITKTETEKQPSITRRHEPEIQPPKSTLYTKVPAKDDTKFESVNQSPATSSRFLETQIVFDFIHAYTRAYESKNLPRFSLFFTPDALENGHSFTEQRDKYITLFQSVDTISLNIDILSSNMKDENIQLKGRFRINLTYPQGQPVQNKGQIFFLLTGNNQQYLVKELSYSFDRTE